MTPVIVNLLQSNAKSATVVFKQSLWSMQPAVKNHNSLHDSYQSSLPWIDKSLGMGKS